MIPPTYLLLLLCIANASPFNSVLSPILHSLKKSVKQGDYEVDLSKQLFYYSQISKCSDSDIKEWSCGYWCNQHPSMSQIQVFSNKSHSGQAFCGYNSQENQLIFSFRSTQDVTNFLADINFLKSKYDACADCSVHSGFLNTYLDVKDSMITCAQELITAHPYASISLMGHSLGGAVATLFAVDLHRLGYRVTNFFTYGSPRVGNQAFQNYFSQNVIIQNKFRITHNKDLVPHSPPNAIGFVHITQEIWFNEDSSTYKVCDMINSEDPNCSLSAWATSMNDHYTYHNNQLNCGDQSI